MKNTYVLIKAAMQALGHTTFMVNQKHNTGILTEQQKRAINSLPLIG